MLQRPLDKPRDAPAVAPPLLAIRNIEVVYDDVILVLRGLSLDVREGAIVALLGANGAGKSTTLKAISGLQVCFSAHIHYRGKDLSGHYPLFGHYQRDINGEDKGRISKDYPVF